MRQQRVIRDTIRQVTHRVMGQGAPGTRAILGRVQTQGFERELISLPVVVEGRGTIMSSDGSMKFMAGISAAGGPDPIGGI